MIKKKIRKISILTLLFILFLSTYTYANEDSKIILQGKYLNLVGGYKIPLANIDGKNTRWGSASVDMLPGTNKWILGHSHAGYVIELIETQNLGTGDMDSWPEMKLARQAKVFEDVDKISGEGVFWINNSWALTSGRKHYRSGFESNWIEAINLDTGEEIRYQIYSDNPENEGDNFHILEALGSGFLRITDKEWSDNYANGNNFLLGRGGYDVLGSPMGPALGIWNIGDKNAKFILDFPLGSPSQKRDPYYIYPTLDPSYDKGPLPIWKLADENGGYWQAGDVGGLAFINHSQIKGIIASHNHGRGVHDYNAQGDCGSGDYFLVDDPFIFYSNLSCNGNRGDHESATLNQAYPKGVYARVGIVYDPDEIAEISMGNRKPWNVSSTLFEWPREGINWKETKGNTHIGGLYWDNERQYLWAVINSPGVGKYLAAYEIIIDDKREEEPIRIPEDFTQYMDPETIPDNDNETTNEDESSDTFIKPIEYHSADYNKNGRIEAGELWDYLFGINKEDETKKHAENIPDAINTIKAWKNQ